MRKQFLVFRLLLGKACNADCSALKAQWQKSRRAMINTHFSLSWLKLILQKTQMMIFPALPPLHFPNLWRICNPHCSISILILQISLWRQCAFSCQPGCSLHTVLGTLPRGSSEGRLRPCTTPENPDQPHQGLQPLPKLSYTQTCPQSSLRPRVLGWPWSCPIGGWIPKMHI